MVPLISVIVPVYNADSYLMMCVKCILGQTIQDYELILVDDGSVDQCLQLCNELAVEYPRISVIHQENAGVSAARNRGLDRAKGKYVAFVDSDDLIASNYLESLLKGMDGDGVILSMCGYERIYGYDYDFPFLPEEYEYLQAKQCAKRILTDNFPVSVWGAMFQRHLIGNIRFPVGIRNNEDKQFLYMYLLENRNGIVAFSNNKQYGYMVRDGSATRRTWNGSSDIVMVADYIRQETIKTQPEWDNLAKNACMKARLDVMKAIVRSEPSEHGNIVYEKLKKDLIELGFPRSGSRRLQVQYLTVPLGKKAYKTLADIYYKFYSEKKRFQLNEKRTRQG